MTVLLLPRLTTLGVANFLESMGGGPLTPEGARAILSERASMLSIAASGGNRSDELAVSIGAAIREIAGQCEFPNNQSQTARAKFDIETAVSLALTANLRSGEALRDDVWSYISTVMVPDVVAWRFPDRAPHRFEGGVRNALQRLWWRGIVLDRGLGRADRWELVRGLSEDAAVQIFERASIGGNPRIAMALAEGWVRMAATIGRPRMQPVMRCATKLVRLRNEIVDLAGLITSDLDATIWSCFVAARESVALKDKLFAS